MKAKVFIAFLLVVFICTSCSAEDEAVSEFNRNIANEVISIVDEFLDGAITAREAYNRINELDEINKEGASVHSRISNDIGLLQSSLGLLRLGDTNMELNPNSRPDFSVIVNIRNRIAENVGVNER